MTGDTKTPALIEDRRAFTNDRTSVLRDALAAFGVTETALRRTCVYATGSVGRGEASTHSDLDIFLLDLGCDPTESDGTAAHRLSRTEQLLLKADIIRAAEAAGFPEFSGDAEWLIVYSADEMLALLGTPQDDALNHFTARLLLLLEGAPLLNDAVYADALRRIVDRYWRDFAANADAFLPVMLANDIMRFWKTLTLNYEAKRNLGAPEGEDPDEWLAKRRLDKFKLGYSRLSICQSAIAYLVWLAARGSVTADDAVAMFELSPTERFERLGAEVEGASPLVRDILDGYAWFLTASDAPKTDLLAWISDRDTRHDARDRNKTFGQAMFDLIQYVNGTDGQLLRYLVV